jgi:hypothetical protein
MRPVSEPRYPDIVVQQPSRGRPELRLIRATLSALYEAGLDDDTVNEYRATAVEPGTDVLAYTQEWVTVVPPK